MVGTVTRVDGGMVGTVTRVEGTSVFVQWHNVAVEDELDFEEVVSTGTFPKSVPHHARVHDGSDDPELVTFKDDGLTLWRVPPASKCRSEWARGFRDAHTIYERHPRHH